MTSFQKQRWSNEQIAGFAVAFSEQFKFATISSARNPCAQHAPSIQNNGFCRNLSNKRTDCSQFRRFFFFKKTGYNESQIVGFIAAFFRKNVASILITESLGAQHISTIEIILIVEVGANALRHQHSLLSRHVNCRKHYAVLVNNLTA